MTRNRPRARTWTLEKLDRSETYELYFNHAALRWDVRDSAGAVVVTRDLAARAARRREDHEADPERGARGSGLAVLPTPIDSRRQVPDHDASSTLDDGWAPGEPPW